VSGLRIAICDDEKIFRDILRRELERYSGERGLSFELHEFGSGSGLLSCGLTFDLIFLDYKMEGKGG
jgi:two-component system LytT family response regulator